MCVGEDKSPARQAIQRRRSDIQTARKPTVDIAKVVRKDQDNIWPLHSNLDILRHGMTSQKNWESC